MREVPEVKDAELAFGSDNYLPKWDEIPKEFKERDNKWVKIFKTWFFKGLAATTTFHPKEGVDPKKALKVIQATMTSWGSKHEHKPPEWHISCPSGSPI